MLGQQERAVAVAVSCRPAACGSAGRMVRGAFGACQYKEMQMTTLAQFLGLPTWNWILIVILLVVVIVLLQIRKRQQ